MLITIFAAHCLTFNRLKTKEVHHLTRERSPRELYWVTPLLRPGKCIISLFFAERISIKKKISSRLPVSKKKRQKSVTYAHVLCFGRRLITSGVESTRRNGMLTTPFARLSRRESKRVVFLDDRGQPTRTNSRYSNLCMCLPCRPPIFTRSHWILPDNQLERISRYSEVFLLVFFLHLGSPPYTSR